MTQAGVHGATCPRCGGSQDHARWCSDAHLGTPAAVAAAVAGAAAQAPATPWTSDQQASETARAEQFRQWQAAEMQRQTNLLERQLAMSDRIRSNVAVLIVFLVIIPIILGFIIFGLSSGS